MEDREYEAYTLFCYMNKRELRKQRLRLSELLNSLLESWKNLSKKEKEFYYNETEYPESDEDY